MRGRPGSVRSLEELGRMLLSASFFMRDFLHSEIVDFHGIPNIPDAPDLAIAAGRKLCEELLEPLQVTFGRLSIRSAYRAPAVNEFGVRRPPAGGERIRTFSSAMFRYSRQRRRVRSAVSGGSSSRRNSSIGLPRPTIARFTYTVRCHSIGERPVFADTDSPSSRQVHFGAVPFGSEPGSCVCSPTSSLCSKTIGNPKTKERSAVLSRGFSARFQPQGRRGLRFARTEVSIASVSAIS
jgi:hypothetical protein